jgi:hypothetical protein
VSTAGFASRLTSLFSGEQARTDIDAASYLSDTSQWRGLLSVRSPWNTGRVVVIATGTDDHQLQQLPDDMTTPRLKAMRTAILWRPGTLAMCVAGALASNLPGGDLPGYLMILWFASQHIFWLSFLACLIAAIASPMLYRTLKRHAQQRLQDKTEHE